MPGLNPHMIAAPFEDVTADQKDLIVRICQHYRSHHHLGKKIFFRGFGAKSLLWFEGDGGDKQLPGADEADLYVLADEGYLFIKDKQGAIEWFTLKRKAFEAFEVLSGEG